MSEVKSPIMNPSPMQLSDKEYYFKLENIILSTFPLLRNLFQTRWKKERLTNWEDLEDRGQRLINELGPDTYSKAVPIQKKLMAKGCPEDWDICLLSLIIQNLGEGRKYKKENEAVQRLTALRNCLSHNPNGEITQSDYQGKVAVIRKSLKELSIPEEDIEQMITNSGISSSDEAFRMVRKLYEKAKKKMRNNKFEAALYLCEEGIGMPSLLPFQLGVAHENRAEFYLKYAVYEIQNQKRSVGNKYLDQTIKDSNRALELNEHSWRAHFLIGKSHRLLNNLKLATTHLSKALAISPVQGQVKIELDNCKMDNRMQTGVDMSNPELLPKTLAEILTKTPEQFAKWKENEHILDPVFREMFDKMMEETHKDKFPGETIMLRGLQYQSGWCVKPDYAAAIECYSKAAEMGNPEGMYKLGECYQDGVGVEKNLVKAFELYKRGAELSPNLPGSWESFEVNINKGVSSCQFGLGVMYEHGIVVEKDYTKALEWYQKSAKNGDAFATHNIGKCYVEGLGVPRSEKMAVMYFQKALILEDSYAAKALMGYFINNLEPEKATAMFQAARYLKHPELRMKNVEEFEMQMKELTRKRDGYNKVLRPLEEMFGLSIKHLTIKERKERIDCVLGKPFKAGSGSAPVDSILAFHKKMAMEKFAVLKTTASNAIGSEAKKKREGDDVIDVKLIGTKAKDGSELAIRIRETREIGLNLIQFVEKKNTFSEEKKRKVLSMLYEMAIRDFEVISFGKETETKLKQLIDELFKSKSGSISKNEEEMKIRLVYVRLNYKAGTSGGTSAAALLKQGIKMYPDNVHYYRLLCVHETDPQFGLSIAEKGLLTFGEDVELLYFKALFVRSIHLKLHIEHPLHVNVSETEAPRKRKIVIDAYEKFLSKAPPGHPNVPNAYFGIAMVHLLILTTTDKVEHFLQQGKEAEGKMLSIASRDTRNADDKLIVETFLSLLSGGRDEDDAGTDILVRKMYLNSPVRRWLITQHRKNINDIYIKKIECQTCSPDPIRSMKVPRDHPFPERMEKVTPITLKEMNPTKANVYHERMIELVIIDVANTSCRCPMIHFIVEDEDGDVTRLNLIGYGTWLEEGGDLAKYGLEIGAKIGLVNPCMLPLKRGQQMLFGIFVEDPDRLISLGRVENMCRFCGDEGAVSNPLKCARCQNAVYCSKECQENDWKLMKHKIVCIPPRIVYDIHIV